MVLRGKAQMQMVPSSQVQLAEVDSHEMFRQVQDVKGAVVLLREGGYVPLPSELKPSLLGKNAMED